MVRPGMRWRHVTISTKYSWLPGSERGWRSRRHKRHSSGDYRKRPPPHEHQKLREYFEGRVGDAVVFPAELRPIVGRHLVSFFQQRDYRLLAVAVCRKHTHMQVELPDDIRDVRWIVGEAKCGASGAIRKQMPGSVWAAGGDYEPIDDAKYQRNTFNYILYKQEPNAWTWSFHDGVPEDWLI